MTRTRLTTFALLTAGVLTIGTGLLAELSGRAVLSGGVAFLVGLGVRAQLYSFSRRIGALAGMGGAIVVTALGVSGEVPLSEHVAWAIRPADVSYVLVGLVAVVGGVVALFTFGPTGIRGLGVDVVHAFRLPQASRPAGGQPSAGVRPQESEAAEVPSADVADGTDAAHAADAAHAVGAADAADAAEPAAPEFADQDHAEQEDLAALSAGQSPHPAATPVGLDAGRGFFIALEGGDGTGKSTQIHLLAEALRDRGAREVVTTREPGGTEAGTKLRSVVLDGDGVTTRAEALVFAADRAHHVASLVRPVLERGGIVITDRYIDSSRAYQAAGRDLGDEEITALSRWATEGLQPDLTIVLDANPAVTRQRTGGRGDQNHLDMLDLQFHTAVRQAFLDFAHAAPQKYAVVDAGRDIDTVASRVLEVVDERMRNRALPDDGSEDETRVVRRVPAAQEWEDGRAPEQAQAPGDGRAPAHDLAPAQDQMPEPEQMPEPSEMPTQVHVRAQEPAHPADAPAQSAGAPAHSAGAEVDPSEAPTTVHPVTPPPPPVTQPAPSTAEARQTSRERLRAQAEIERRARERLRAQRDGGGRGDHSDRGDYGQGGAGPR
jgi:dTMP kinase